VGSTRKTHGAARARIFCAHYHYVFKIVHISEISASASVNSRALTNHNATRPRTVVAPAFMMSGPTIVAAPIRLMAMRPCSPSPLEPGSRNSMNIAAASPISSPPTRRGQKPVGGQGRPPSFKVVSGASSKGMPNASLISTSRKRIWDTVSATRWEKLEVSLEK
jgi:hypothetical protein